ncbi:MAG: serine/threonine protein kinase [Woeseia sp.]|jgi:Ser/Thr protein kinase RdoA (MazF antagonist)
MSDAGDGTLAYQDLQPDDILDTLESLGFTCNGRLLALNSYENRVYQVGVEDGRPVVAKFYRPARWSDDAIAEEHTFAAELAAAEIPVVAPLEIAGRTLHHAGSFRVSVSPCFGGRSPELDDPDMLRQLGRFVARMHLIGERSEFHHRPRIDIDSYGYDSRDFLLDENFIPAELGEVYDGTANLLLENIELAFDRAGAVRELRLHADFHPGNVLVQEDRVHIVDLDDARSGPAVQDLWMLLSGDRDEQTPQLGTLLEGYEEFRRFDARELHLVEALRSLRMMHYAAWLARRWEDPAFKQAFPWFNSRRYWDDHVLALREQTALVQEPPLAWYV